MGSIVLESSSYSRLDLCKKLEQCFCQSFVDEKYCAERCGVVFMWVLLRVCDVFVTYEEERGNWNKKWRVPRVP